MKQRRADFGDEDLHGTGINIYNNGLPKSAERNHSDVAAALANVTFYSTAGIKALLSIAMAETVPAKETLLTHDEDGDDLIATFEGCLELTKAYSRVGREAEEVDGR